MFVHCSESLGLDSVNALDSESAFDCVLSTFAFVDSVIVFESALDSALASGSVGLDSMLIFESALDSVDSLFLRVAFSRILSRFCVLRCFFAKRGIPLSPLSPAPKKPPLFLLRFACKPSARQTGREPRCIRF